MTADLAAAAQLAWQVFLFAGAGLVAAGALFLIGVGAVKGCAWIIERFDDWRGR